VLGTCTCCGAATRLDRERCGWCGAQRLLYADGTPAGHRRYGGFWRRMLASAIDVVPLAVLLALVFLVPQRYVIAGEPGEYRDDFLAEVVSVVLVAWFLYPCVALGARGRTVGKRLLDLHVVASDGSPVGYPRAAMRDGIGRVLELALLVPVGIASAASLAFDERARALHDRMGGTACVRGAPVPRPSAAAADEAPATA
jgi:uncharacterized RDD family membrane protein YckC